MKTKITFLAMFIMATTFNLSYGQYTTPNPTATGGDYITGFSLNNVTVSGIAKGTSPYYDDLTNTYTATVVPEESYTFSIDLTRTYSVNRLVVWIDWNQDEIFQVSEEVVFKNDFTDLDETQTVSQEITIPAVDGTTVKLGTTRARMRLHYYTPGNTTGEPDSGDGKVIDFNVTLSETPAYCTPSATGTIGGDIIDNIGFSGTPNLFQTALSKTDYDYVGNTGDGYVDKTNTEQDLNVGDTYSLAIHLPYSYNSGKGGSRVNAWIDWNNDGEFTDANEYIVQNVSTPQYKEEGATDVTYTQNITVPEGAEVGQVRARFSSLWNKTSASPCGTFQGLTFDMTINVTNETLSTSDVSFAGGAVNAYPTAVENVLTIETAEAKTYTATVFNILGAKVAATTSASTGVAKVDMSSLASGVYLVVLEAEGTKSTIKVVKK